jgi:two-component system, LuxR family, response regulator FixJ
MPIRMHPARSACQEKGSRCRDWLRVHVVDDDKIARDTISAILTASGYRVSKYRDAAEFLSHISARDSGYLLVDLRMPGMNGIQLVDRLVQSEAPFAMLVVSGHADVPLAVQAMNAGALDIIQKPFTRAVLLDQMKRVKRTWVALEKSRRRMPGSRVHALSVREHQVLKLTLAGFSSKEIARQLGGSPRTVETHRSNIMRKMGVKRLSELLDD